MTMPAFDILLVEDDKEQADLIVDTAKICRSTIRWNVVGDGETALDCLRASEESLDAARPGLVLLDLNLPKLDGLEVLREIKKDPGLRGLPVIIMSSSRNQADISAVYELGANCYIAKPASYEGLCSLVRFIEAFLTLPKTAGEGIRAPDHEARTHSLN